MTKVAAMSMTGPPKIVKDDQSNRPVSLSGWRIVAVYPTIILLSPLFQSNMMDPARSAVPHSTSDRGDGDSIVTDGIVVSFDGT